MKIFRKSLILAASSKTSTTVTMKCAQKNGNSVLNCNPQAPSNPSEMENYLDLCVNAIFGTNIGNQTQTQTSPGFFTVTLQNEPEPNYRNYTVDDVVNSCIRKYVDIFSMLVLRWCFDNCIPSFCQNTISQFHGSAVKGAQSLCECILMYQPDADGGNVMRQLNICLDKMLNLVKTKNYNRREEVSQKIASLLKKDFLYCCKQKYDAVVSNHDNDNSTSLPQTKFYDQIGLDKFLDDTQNSLSRILDFKTIQLFKGMLGTAEHSELLRAREDATSNGQKCMAEESKRVSNHNRKNLERAEQAAENYVSELKGLQSNVMTSLYQDCYKAEILQNMSKETETRAQKIRQLFESHALENQHRIELTNTYVGKAHKIYLDYVQYAQQEKSKFRQALETFEKGRLAAIINEELKGDKVSKEPLKRYIQILERTTEHHRSVDLRESAGKNVNDSGNVTNARLQSGVVSNADIKTSPAEGRALRKGRIPHEKAGSERTEKRAKR